MINKLLSLRNAVRNYVAAAAKVEAVRIQDIYVSLFACLVNYLLIKFQVHFIFLYITVKCGEWGLHSIVQCVLCAPCA